MFLSKLNMSGWTRMCRPLFLYIYLFCTSPVRNVSLPLERPEVSFPPSCFLRWWRIASVTALWRKWSISSRTHESRPSFSAAALSSRWTSTRTVTTRRHAEPPSPAGWGSLDLLLYKGYESPVFMRPQRRQQTIHVNLPRGPKEVMQLLNTLSKKLQMFGEPLYCWSSPRLPESERTRHCEITLVCTGQRKVGTAKGGRRPSRRAESSEERWAIPVSATTSL